MLRGSQGGLHAALVSVYWGMCHSYLGFVPMFQRSARANWFGTVLNGIEIILRAQAYRVQMHLDLMFWTAVWDVCCDWGSVQDGFFHEQGREA